MAGDDGEDEKIKKIVRRNLAEDDGGGRRGCGEAPRAAGWTGVAGGEVRGGGSGHGRLMFLSLLLLMQMRKLVNVVERWNLTAKSATI